MPTEVIRHVLTKIRSEITVGEALDLWLAVAERVGLDSGEPVLPVTLRKYRQVARDRIRPFFDGMMLRQVTAPVEPKSAPPPRRSTCSMGIRTPAGREDR